MPLTTIPHEMTTNITPAGVVLPYAGATAPSGWLLCDGSAVSRTTYANLFAAIGTAFGTGDGSTTFNLPDLRGRVAVGKDNMGGSAASRMTTAGSGVDGATLTAPEAMEQLLDAQITLGANGGAETHTLTTPQMPAHSHNTGATISGRNTSTGGGETIVYAGNTYASTSVGGGGAHNNTQPSIVLNSIIRT